MQSYYFRIPSTLLRVHQQIQLFPIKIRTFLQKLSVDEPKKILIVWGIEKEILDYNYGMI